MLFRSVTPNEASRSVFTMTSTMDTGERRTRSFDLNDRASLLEEAKAGGFWCHVAGTAHHMVSNFPIVGNGGITVDNHGTNLPVKKGLSSSAAVCASSCEYPCCSLSTSSSTHAAAAILLALLFALLRFLAADGQKGTAVALPPRAATATATEFIVHAHGATPLKHRGIIFLEHRATGQMLDADEEDEAISARWSHKGEWQQFAVEKPSAPALPQTPKKQQQAQHQADRKSVV